MSGCLYSVVVSRIEDRMEFVFRIDKHGGAVAMNFNQFEECSEDYDDEFFLASLDDVNHVIDAIKKSEFFVSNFDLTKIKVITWWR